MNHEKIPPIIATKNYYNIIMFLIWFKYLYDNQFKWEEFFKTL